MSTEARSPLNSIRTDHTGGLRIPVPLRDLYQRYGKGTATEAELRAGQDLAVREVIARQESLGFAVVNDGELRRIGGFQDSFGGAVTGFDAIPYGPGWAPGAAPVSSTRPPEPGSGPRRIETGLSAPPG